MSSDEDFSLVVEPQQTEETVESLKTSISSYQKQHQQLIQEQQELATARDQLQETAQQYRQRSHKVSQDIEAAQRWNSEELAREEVKLKHVKQEENELMMELQRIRAALKEEEATNRNLREQTEVFTSLPEKKLVFRGQTGKDGGPAFDMKTRIDYPMDSGTALVTFEEEAVAKKILSMKKHRVELGGECSITVEARPVHLMMPQQVEIESEVCPQRVLVSNLPKMDTETLLDRLEIHFGKTRNGGGEVDSCELLPDSGTVVITFLSKNIARGLTDTEHHEVELKQKKYTLRVTPFLNGKITTLKTKMRPCARTVLLTGIPAVMERETLQDQLEIHFQKNSNGGGEVEAFLYNPEGQNLVAVFTDASSDPEEE